MEHLIAPSVLSADFGNLERDINMLNESHADWIHVDIMDGVFVPNISFGFPLMKVLQQHSKKPLDVHLMIVDPDRYISRFAEYGTYMLCVHYEACNHLHRTVSEIKKMGMKAAVSLNPHTPVSLLENIIQDLDMVLLMSVNPGFAAQSFIPQTYDKISTLKEMILRKGCSSMIEVDGGVSLGNASEILKCGTDILVAGNTVFASEDPLKTIQSLKTISV